MTSISEAFSIRGMPQAETRDRKGLNRFSNTYKIAMATNLLRSTAQYGKWKNICQKNDVLAGDLADWVIERHHLLEKAKNGQQINWAHFDSLTENLGKNNIHLFSSKNMDGFSPSPQTGQTPSVDPLPEIRSSLALSPPLLSVKPNGGSIPKAVAKDEAVIMDMRYKNYVLSRALLGYGDDTHLFLPLGELAGILDLNIMTDADKGTANGWFLSEDRTFDLDLNTRTATVAGQSTDLSPDNFFVRENDIYVDTHTLSSWFPVDFEYDFSQQSLFITPREELPFQTRLAREASWKNKKASQSNSAQLPLKASQHLLFEPSFVDIGVSGKYSDSDNPNTEPEASYYLLGKGDLGMMSSEFYLTGDEDDNLNTARLTLEQNDPGGELLGPLQATNFAIGDVRIPGFPIVGGGKYERGVVVGNQPLDAAGEYDTTFFQGNLPPGWDVEVYRNNILQNTQTVGSDGRYNFEDIPIYYGNNDFKLIFYGPQGQKEVRTERIVVGNEMIKKGSTEYQFSVTQKDTGLFDPNDTPTTMDRESPRIMGKYKYGLNQNLSLEGGILTQEINQERHDYVNAGGQGYLNETYLRGNYIHDMDGGDALEALAQKKVGPLDLKVKQQFFENFVEEGDTNQSNTVNSRTEVSAFGQIKSTALTPDMPFSISLKTADREYSTEKSIGGRLSANLKGTYVNNYLQWKDDSDSAVESPTLEGTAQAISQLGKVRLRANMGYDLHPEPRITKAQVSGFYPITNQLSSELTLTQDLENDDQVTGSIGLNWNNGKYILSPQVSYNSDDEFTAFLSVSTSLGMEPRSRNIKLSSARQADQGAVSARVFLDKNNNNIFDPKDEPIQGATVKAAQAYKSAETDEDGIAFLTGLRKYNPTDILLETESLEDPYWEPSQKGSSILPRPGHVEMLEIPVVPTGEIDGTLYLEDKNGERINLKHVPVQLVDASGQVVQTIKSEYDGFYLFMKIPPGDYFVRLDPAHEKNLETDTFSPLPVRIGNDGTVVSGFDLAFKKHAKESIPGPASSPQNLADGPKTDATGKIPDVTKQPAPVSESATARKTPLEKQYYGLHLSSYQTMGKAIAGVEFQKNKFKGVLDDKDFTIQKIDLGPEKGSWYRVLAGSARSTTDLKDMGRAIRNLQPYCKPMAIGQADQFSVHLASYRTSDQAMRGLQTLAEELGPLLGDQVSIRRVDLGGKGIWYRVLAGRFDDRDGATPFQAALTARKQYARVMALSFP